jgi:DNA polymerase-3 subunit epsilon
MREIALDTETTGMDPQDGHKIIEIGCVEMMNHIPTGKVWHSYINPEREVDAGAVAVHGIKTEFLKDKPTFGELVGSFMDFIGDARMVIHNAEFDVKFLNAELKPYGFAPIRLQDVTDTLLMARQKYPGQPANLDALCRRFGVDLSERELHGALLDAQLLASVYLELMGGRQHGLGLSATKGAENGEKDDVLSASVTRVRELRPARPHAPSEEEIALHHKMLEGIKDNLWKKIAD